ncbi:hypothetical protein ACFQAS_08795 [Halopenitus salinus]|uniref:DUF7322 domain-containing protein n=1 Tax=Halopenitus salinus TaxID=1198295 RepID=A0ABD5UTL0_9EURY
MIPLEDADRDDGDEGSGEFAFDEPSPTEVDLAPKAPSVSNPADRFSEPTGDLGDPGDLDPRTHRTFVICVLYSNAALFGVSLGVMIWYFRGRLRVGAAVAVLGLLAGIRTYQHYRSWQQYRRERDAEESP